MRNVLLIEPNYKNKYPPLGLMKISSYHKNLGDRVVFFKGKSPDLRDFIWDRIYITTLFTFHWKITIDTIKYYKRSIYHTDNFYIGGIMASILQKEIFDEIRIKPHFGLLTSAKEIGEEKNTNIEKITPDYDILDEINYNYSVNDAYFTSTTKGCTRNCEFCAVPHLEPRFQNRVKIKKQIEEINKKYGKKRNLLLMDNNVLASNEFDQIIDEIKEIGFYKGAMFVDPIMFEVYLNRLKFEKNKFEKEKIRKKAINEIINLKKKVRGRETLKKYQEIIDKYNIDLDSSISILNKAGRELKPIFEKYHNKAPKKRYVDYNQGLDLRYLTEEKIKRFSEISIRPLRIAFDYASLKDMYVNACRLADKYGIEEVSNYLLYNYNDKPEDLYERLKINIELNEELNNTTIYSFPMKYIPVDEIDRKRFIAKNWNMKFIRAIQAITNVTNGVVGAGKSFFYKAFGKDLEEFKKILIMPEDYIVYRHESEENGKTSQWWKQYLNLSEKQKKEALELIHKNNFEDIQDLTNDQQIVELLKHYKNKRKKGGKKTRKKNSRQKSRNKRQLSLF